MNHRGHRGHGERQRKEYSPQMNTDKSELKERDKNRWIVSN
jgi:hypothetical protein